MHYGEYELIVEDGIATGMRLTDLDVELEFTEKQSFKVTKAGNELKEDSDYSNFVSERMLS